MLHLKHRNATPNPTITTYISPKSLTFAQLKNISNFTHMKIFTSSKKKPAAGFFAMGG